MSAPEAWDQRIELEPVREGQLDALAALEAGLQDFPWSRGHFADSVAAGHSVWVASLGGIVVGFSVVMSVIDEAHLLNLGVGRQQQGQGIGARLLRTAMEAARRNGGRRFLLEVRPGNSRALKLYSHFGFARIGLRRGYYPGIAGREDAIVMARDL